MDQSQDIYNQFINRAQDDFGLRSSLPDAPAAEKPAAVTTLRTSAKPHAVRSADAVVIPLHKH